MGKRACRTVCSPTRDSFKRGGGGEVVEPGDLKMAGRVPLDSINVVGPGNLHHEKTMIDAPCVPDDC